MQGALLVRHDSEQYTARRPSTTIWDDCELGNGRDDLGRGFFFRDDFLDLPTGKYTAMQATTGTFALDDAEGGVALADCNSVTSAQGINVQKAGEFIKCGVARTKQFFEARVKVADIATGPELFVGLAVVDTTVIASSALTAQAIGFKTLTDDGVLLATCKDGTSETTVGSIHTLVDDAWVKLGFMVEGSVADSTAVVSFYVNGVYKGKITANIPTTELTVTFVCQSAGTTDPILHIDWVEAASQLA